MREHDLDHHGDAELAPGLVDLAVNVRQGTPPGWLRAVLHEALDASAAYPDARPARAAIAAVHGRPPEEVLLTAGAAEAFTLVARALRPRRAVVVHPSFTEPEAALRAAGHPVERLVLAAPEYRLDPAAVPGDADLVVLGNPTNPTSVLHPAADVAALARPGRVLVVDEAFADTVPGEPASLAGRRDLPGLLVVRSLTKTWGLAGLRVGYCLGPAGLLARLGAAQPHWPLATPALAALVACTRPEARAEATAAAHHLIDHREVLVQAMPPGVEVLAEPRSSFVLLRVPGGERVRAELRARGWAVRRGDTFPGLDDDHMRVAVRAPATSRAFAAALAAILEGIPPAPPTPRAAPRLARGDPLSTDPAPFAGTLLGDTIAAITPRDAVAERAARDRLDRMTKPPGSLGVLEDVAAQLAGTAGACPPPLPTPAAVAVFAGDHGVHAQGVTPWPQEVTAQMVANLVRGGAVVNAFAAQLGADVVVVDVGVATPYAVEPSPALLSRKVRSGTADLAVGPAMTVDEARSAVEAGIEVAASLVAGHGCLVTGDMGITNTTASAALVCAFTGASPAAATGRGTGVDDPTLARKVEVVGRAVARVPAPPTTPEAALAVLAEVGGLEHAALAGFVLGAAAGRVPVLLDGVIAGSAALVAAALCPTALEHALAGHTSAEPGHALALRALGLRPLLGLDLRLGEGTGALLALPLVTSAARALRDVATFDSAGVTEKAR